MAREEERTIVTHNISSQRLPFLLRGNGLYWFLTNLTFLHAFLWLFATVRMIKKVFGRIGKLPWVEVSSRAVLSIISLSLTIFNMTQVQTWALGVGTVPWC